MVAATETAGSTAGVRGSAGTIGRESWVCVCGGGKGDRSGRAGGVLGVGFRIPGLLLVVSEVVLGWCWYGGLVLGWCWDRAGMVLVWAGMEVCLLGCEGRAGGR